ncbi:MAG: iron ABC transporter permease [Alistipes sp.]|nr:iron ABC transporter permease [Alistipes sp.]
MHGKRLHTSLFVLLTLMSIAAAFGDLLLGTTSIPLDEVWRVIVGSSENANYVKIITELRLPKIIVAVLAGMALSASGLEMQTLFRNPLAGPYVLGINSGASLGVALFTLALPILGGLSGSMFMRLGITGVAWIGSALILMLVMLLSRKIKSVSTILIIGMMLGSAISAIVGVLQYVGSEESLKTFVVWTMGSLSTVTMADIVIFAPIIIVGLMLGVVAIKSLNMLLLGEGYARTMGLNVRRSRTIIFLSTTLLAGTVTAFCGPIGFIGLAMPHLARMTFRTADHRILLPATILWGAFSMLVCCLVTDLVAHHSLILPVNTITALLGVPIIIFVVIRHRNRQ